MTGPVIAPLDAVAPAQHRRLRFAGNSRAVLGLAVTAAVAAAVGAAVVIVSAVLAARWPFPAFWASGVGVGLLALALVLGVGLLLWWWRPPRAREVFRDPAATPEMRKTARLIATDWRGIAEKIFPPVRGIDGVWWLPGLLAVSVEDGALAIAVRFPALSVPGGREAFLDSAAQEFPDIVPVASAQALSRGMNVGTICVIVDDVTEQVRHVEN